MCSPLKMSLLSFYCSTTSCKGLRRVSEVSLASVLSQCGQEVFVSEDFICQPVEDIEDQKAHWKNGSGNGVDPFRPLYKAPAYIVEA